MKRRIYVSHSIRGIKGKDATDADMIANNLKAAIFGKQLVESYPGIEFYIPGEHDEFVLIAFQRDYLDESEILSVDCEIVDRCQAILAYIPDQYISNGMLTEILYAQCKGTPVLFAPNIAIARGVISDFLERMKR